MPEIFFLSDELKNLVAKNFEITMISAFFVFLVSFIIVLQKLYAIQITTITKYYLSHRINTKNSSFNF